MDVFLGLSVNGEELLIALVKIQEWVGYVRPRAREL